MPANAGSGYVEVENSASETNIAAQILTVSYSEINSVSDFLTTGTDYAFQTQLIMIIEAVVILGKCIQILMLIHNILVQKLPL